MSFTSWTEWKHEGMEGYKEGEHLRQLCPNTNLSVRKPEWETVTSTQQMFNSNK